MYLGKLYSNGEVQFRSDKELIKIIFLLKILGLNKKKSLISSYFFIVCYLIYLFTNLVNFILICIIKIRNHMIFIKKEEMND